jgi:hypothetical protein
MKPGKIKEKIISMLNGQTIQGARKEYYCSNADETAIIFAPTPKTKKIMIPAELALEWIQAYQFGLINLTMTARQMRQIVQDHSVWAAFLHGFETHLYAIVKTWAEAHPQ